jgi:holliday junction DNA helicase RuvA
MALNMLRIGTVDTISQAIAAGDTKYIQSAQGVGRRVAERVVVELKDKVGLSSTADDSIFVGTEKAQQDEAIQGLIALGFDTQDAIKALQGIDEQLPAESRIKEALKQRT